MRATRSSSDSGRSATRDAGRCAGRGAGRSAGRGRGMGLPTAWRLARQQGGDVHFDGGAQGVTRFRLTLPLAASEPPAHVNGHRADQNGRCGAA